MITTALDQLVKELERTTPVRVVERPEDVMLFVDRSVDIDRLDDLVEGAVFVDPIARYELPKAWRVWLMKRSGPRPHSQYRVVRVIDSHFEYVPLTEDTSGPQVP